MQLCAPLRADFVTGAARAIGVASTDRRGAQNQAPVANARAPNGAAILDPASETLGEGPGGCAHVRRCLLRVCSQGVFASIGHTEPQARASIALRQRLRRVGRVQNVQLCAQVARAQDGQITPGCFEIQDTRAWCTHTPVLARSTVTHRDACARVCVCPACGPRA